jgi:predicted RecB family nuclease
LKSLCQAIDRKGSIVVYSNFESGRLKNLTSWLPKYEDTITGIQDRLWDLYAVIRANVYHPGFAGSFSLKSVLPALVPEMSYKGMEVSEGSEAGMAWEKMIRDQVDAAERNRLREALLAYCKQDTLAMVRLVDVLAAK